MLLIAVAVLAAAAAGCDVCSGVSVHREPATDVVLSATGDLSSCACVWVFAYSAGPTQGRVTLSAAPGVGAITVYGDAEGHERLADLPESTTVDGAVVYSRTGLIRVELETVAAPAAGASVTIAATAINAVPLIELREDVEMVEGLGSLLDQAVYPWTTGSHPLPMTVVDYDNFDRGLRAELSVNVASTVSTSTMSVMVPFVPGVEFEFGSPGATGRFWRISGPGSAVEAAIANARFVPTDIDMLSTEEFMLSVDDLGNSGDGPPGTVSSRLLLGVYAAGVIDVPRNSRMLNTGPVAANQGAEALFLVHDAYRIDFVELDLPPDDTGRCTQFLRVWDGSDLATARLLSTDLSLSGEICGSNRRFLPSYSGTTGEFVVEHLALSPHVRFNTAVSATPVGFRAWLLDDAPLQVAVGDKLLLPQIMVTSPPDPSAVAVNITVSGGAASLSLRFADSFADMVRASDGELLSLDLTDIGFAMLRMGDALRELQLAVASPGIVTVRVDALSGGEWAESLEFEIEAVEVAIVLASVQVVHVFRPVPVSVVVGVAGVVTAQVAVETGLGQLSVDPRAGLWIEVGYGESVAVTGTAAEVNAAFESLVYKATEGGGLEVIRVRVGTAEQRLEIDVLPDCDGTHFVYGREGSITERPGPPSDRHGTLLNCGWFIIGARELQFPYFEVVFGTMLVNDVDNTLFYNIRLDSDPGVLRSTPIPFFEVLYNSLGVSAPGFVGVFGRSATINDPPVMVVPEGLVRVVRGSTTRLRTLYVNDFDEGVIVASLETDAGWLQEEGTRRITVEAETFEELDAWVTGIDFLAGDVQTTATLTLRAMDDGLEEGMAEFQIEVLSCSETVAEVELDDGSATVTVGDGSGTADYADGLVCTWRLTGAPGPAALRVAFLDLECDGDAVTVYDGSSVAGRRLGSFCQGDELAAEVGTLVSSTGSFFVELVSDGDGAVGDGFSFVYGAVAGGVATDLGAAPPAADPERTDATVIALDGASVVVFGGFNGVRAVSSTIIFEVGQGWSALVGDDPAARSRAAGAAVSGSRIVVHGGVDIGGSVVAETWVGDIAGNAIAWRQLYESGGPATAGAAMVTCWEEGPSGDSGMVYLLDASGVWVLGGDDNTRASGRGGDDNTRASGPGGDDNTRASGWGGDDNTRASGRGGDDITRASGRGGDDNTWAKIADVPEAVVATSSAYRQADGLVYATGTDGAVWTLSLATGRWTETETAIGIGCAPWTCSGAMLGPDEYVVGGWRVNVTNLALPAGQAVSALPAAATGQAVGGQYLGQPSLFVFESGAMTAVPLTLGVLSHRPLVSPETGGTVVTVVGEQLSTCGDPVCDFGGTVASDSRQKTLSAATTLRARQAPAAGSLERSATCADPVCELGSRQAPDSRQNTFPAATTLRARQAPAAGGTVASDSRQTTFPAATTLRARQAPAVVRTERSATCTTPAGTETVAVTLVCVDGRRYTSPDPLAYFSQPTIAAVEPSNPAAGETVLITVADVAAETLALVDAPLCRFDGSTVVAAARDGPEIRCRVPEDAAPGARLGLEISLDGQQFVGGAAEVQISKPSDKDPLFDKSRATIAGLVLAGLLAIAAILLYRRTPSRPARTVVLSVAAGIVDIYFDVVFASKLRDEGSSLSNWSFGALLFMAVINLVLITMLVVRKTRLSSGRHAFVHWLETAPRAVVALSITCMLGLARVSAFGLLMSRLGGLAMFDAPGMSPKDWHIVAALDVGGALLEDVSQLTIQIIYLSGANAEIDVATVVTVSVTVAMVVYIGFQGLARAVVLGSVGRRMSARVHGIEESLG